MYKKIIQQLFDGEVYPSQNIKPKDPRYQEVSRDIGRLKEHFQSTLTDNDCELFDKLDVLITESASIYDYECFSHGFLLGAAFMIEVFSGLNDFTKDKR